MFERGVQNGLGGPGILPQGKKKDFLIFSAQNGIFFTEMTAKYGIGRSHAQSGKNLILKTA